MIAQVIYVKTATDRFEPEIRNLLDSMSCSYNYCLINDEHEMGNHKLISRDLSSEVDITIFVGVATWFPVQKSCSRGDFPNSILLSTMPFPERLAGTDLYPVAITWFDITRIKFAITNLIGSQKLYSSSYSDYQHSQSGYILRKPEEISYIQKIYSEVVNKFDDFTIPISYKNGVLSNDDHIRILIRNNANQIEIQSYVGDSIIITKSQFFEITKEWFEEQNGVTPIVDKLNDPTASILFSLLNYLKHNKHIRIDKNYKNNIAITIFNEEFKIPH